MKTKQKRRNFGIVMPVIVTMLLMAVGSAVIRPAVAEAEAPAYNPSTQTWSITENITAKALITAAESESSANLLTDIIALSPGTTLTIDDTLSVKQITKSHETNLGNITVQNGGSLTVTDGIHAQNITVETGGSITSTGARTSGEGIQSGGTFTVSGGTVTAYGATRAIVGNTISITGGTVTATGTAYGINANTLTISGDSTEVTATGTSNGAIYAPSTTISAPLGITNPASGVKIETDGVRNISSGNLETSVTIKAITDISITTTTLPGGTVGAAYTSTKVEGTAGGRAITWSATGLPDGLNMAADGTISGTISATAPAQNYPVTVTADAGGTLTKTADLSISVTAATIPVTGVTINEGPKIAIVAGSTATQLNATVAPANASDKTIKWSSSAPAIAEVDNTGKVTGKAKGTAVITAESAADSSKKASITVEVTVPVQTISLSADPATIAVNETVSLKTAYTPAGATLPEITYSSSDPTVADVDAKGVVTGKKAGTVTITAKIDATKNGNVSVTDATCSITVSANKPLIKEPTLPTSLTLNQKMTDIQLTATGPDAADIKWTWKFAGSSTELPPGLALSEAGVISGTPTKAGTYTVAVTATHKTQITLSDTKEFTLVVGKGGVVLDTNGVTISGITGANAPHNLSNDFLMTVKILPGDDTPTGKTETVADINKLFRGVNNSNLRMRMLDITVRNTTDNQAVSKTTNPVEIVLDVSTDYTRYTLVPFRYHNGVVTIFTKLDKRPTNTADYKDGTFYYDKNGNQIYLYTNSFSLYTLVYTTVDTYTVTFNSNGGTAVMDAIVQQGATITAPTAPTKTGFTFGGWYTDAGLTTEWDRTQPINGNMTLYASWTQAATNPGSDGDLRGANAPQTSDYMAMVYVMIALLAALAAGYAVYGISKRNEES